jgi:hypothetical protein
VNKKYCLIEKSIGLPQQKSRANSMIKHVVVYYQSHKGAGLTVQQYVTPIDWDRQKHQQ